MTLWLPAYGIEGVVKAITAVIAIVTAVALWKLLPQAIAWPSPAQFRKVNLDLLEVWQAEVRVAAMAREAAGAQDELALELSCRAVTETALRDSEERFRLLLQSNVTEALYLLDPNGNVESWNAGAERIKGYTAAEIIGRNFMIFFTPEDVASGEPARMLARACGDGRFAADAWRVRKDGSRFLARVALDAIRRDDGTLRGFVKVTLDITDHRIEEEQRAIIIEAAPNGMLIVDEAGVITLANSQVERIFDYPRGTLVGQLLETLVPEQFRVAHHALRSAFTGGRSERGMAPDRQFIGHKWGGDPVTIEIMLSPVTTPRGRIVVASLVDVTDRMRLAGERQKAENHGRLAIQATNARLDLLARDLTQARDRAELANKAKSRFLAGITHELRTPLHGILGYAELLSLEGGLTEKQSQRLEVMMASGHHLLGMINAVLDMSQIEADEMQLQPVDIELTDLVRVCLDVVRPAADAKELSLGLTATGPLRLFADPTRLRQVLINLLGNAVKFTLAGSVEVRLRPTADGASIRLEVVDTGPGIWLRHCDKLFQTFERLNAEAVSGIEGAGLGLALAARLVQLMKGRIGYIDNPGGGSVFWFELPASEAVASADIAAAEPSPPAGRPLRVLVVDDEVMNRSIASGFLRDVGHDVVCVESGAAAVASAAAEDFDVILMDVRMPGMNGMEATRQIRNLPAPRGAVRVVAVTAQAFAQQIEMCRQAGVDSHVSKPFNQVVLLAALEDIRTGGPARLPTPDATADAEAEVPLFEQAMFKDTTELLPAGEAGEHLLTMITRCETLLCVLRRPEILANAAELGEDAHRLAGSAGMFGFLSVAAAARRFECATETDPTETETFANLLAAAIVAALPMMRQELAATATTAYQKVGR
ncbi:MAG: PAS domain S-box protein [Rhodopila sp.]